MESITAMTTTSTRPYLIRALHEWCCDNGLTPYVAVRVDDSVRVPREFVKDGEIVLNVSLDATSALILGNEYIEFRARFAGVAREVFVPISRVMAIYARENGQGMAFPAEDPEVGAITVTDEPATMRSAVELAAVPGVGVGESPAGDEPQPPRPAGPRPVLKRVK